MPTSQLRGLAKSHHLSLSVVERYWAECKATIGPKDDATWAATYKCTKAKCRKYGKKSKSPK